MNADHLQLALAVISGGLLQWITKPLWSWLARRSERELSREQQVDILRRALDKAGIRQNATVSVCDLLLIALELVHELPPAADRAKQQARQKLVDVVNTLERISGAGDGEA